MCQIAGRLAIFGDDRRLPEIPTYDHDNLGPIFRRIRELIESLIHGVREYEYEQRFFVGVGLGMQAALDPSWFHADWKWYIGVNKGDMTEQECRELLQPGELDWKLGSSRQVEILFKRRAEGLQLRPVGRVVRALPNRPDWIYYELDKREGAALARRAGNPDAGHAIQGFPARQPRPLPGQSDRGRADARRERGTAIRPVCRAGPGLSRFGVGVVEEGKWRKRSWVNPPLRLADLVLQNGPHCHAPIHPPAPVPTPVPHPPLPLAIIKGQPNVLIGKCRRRRSHGHDLPCMLPACVPAGPGMIMLGSATVLIGKLPAARVGDMTLHASCVAPIPMPPVKSSRPAARRS